MESEAMHNMSVHQLPQYYQPPEVPTTAWTALVSWYTCHKLACIKIWQNFWFALLKRGKSICISFSLIYILTANNRKKEQIPIVDQMIDIFIFVLDWCHCLLPDIFFSLPHLKIKEYILMIILLKCEKIKFTA